MSKEHKEQQYFTAEGTPTKLHDLVRAEPEWATSRIRALEVAIERIDELEAQLTALREQEPVAYRFNVDGQWFVGGSLEPATQLANEYNSVVSPLFTSPVPSECPECAGKVEASE